MIIYLINPIIIAPHKDQANPEIRAPINDKLKNIPSKMIYSV